MYMCLVSGACRRSTFANSTIATMSFVRMSVLTLMVTIGAAGIAIAAEPMESPSEPAESIDATRNDDVVLEEVMATLADEMTAIRRTRNPEDRRHMMDKHRENMREALVLMREMGGEAMRSMMAEHMSVQDDMSQPARKRVHRHKQPPVSGGGSESGGPSRLTDLELRLDMMQVMMESLIEQCAAP